MFNLTQKTWGKPLTGILILGFFLAPFQTALAATSLFPKEINYQAKLTDASGVAVADGNYNITFRLYTTASSATTTNIWEETHTGANRVPLTSGLLSTMMGQVTSLASVNFNQTLYLGVEVGGTTLTPTWDGEMSPRKQLGAVPAALVADTLDGLDSSAFVQTNGTSTIASSSAQTLLTLNQSGAGNILDLIGSTGTNFFSVLSSGNVGIGTTSPYAKLSVAGQVVASFFTATSTAATSTFHDIKIGGTELTDQGRGDGSIAIGSSNILGSNISAPNYIFGVANIISGGSSYTNYIVGRNNDVANLQDAYVFGRNNVVNNGLSDGYIFGSNVTNSISNSIQIGLSDVAKITLRNSGNLGIGTTSPYAKLSVVGSSDLGNSALAGYFIGTTTATSTFGGNLAINGTGTTTSSGGFNVSSGCFAVGGTCVGGSGTVGVGTTGQLPYYAANGTTLSATSSLFIKTDGFVGVNNTNPIASLDVRGLANVFKVTNTNTNGTFILGNGSINDLFLRYTTAAGGTTNTDYAVFSSGAGGGSTGGGSFFKINPSTVDDTSYVLNVQENGTSYLAVQGNGNVGVGTSSPYAKLSVVGETLSDSFNATSSVGYKLGGTTLLTASSTGFNTFVGFGVGSTAITSATRNTAMGYYAMQNINTGTNNTAVGYNALRNNSTGLSNTVLGSDANTFNISGSYNTVLGVSAMGNANNGSSNVVIGEAALALSFTPGDYNNALGRGALYSNNSSNNNSGFGSYSLYNNTNGTGNSSFGNYSLFSNTTGASSTAMGYYAGYANTTGNANTFIGTNSGYGDGLSTTTTTLTNATAIGYNSQVTASNSLILGGTGAYGVNVGIGTTSPWRTLSVNGSSDLGTSALAGFFTGTTTATSTLAGGLQARALNITSTTATSTFANGIQLSGGCFRDASGSCLGKGRDGTFIVAAYNSRNKAYADYVADYVNDEVEINQAITAAYSSTRGRGGKIYLLEGDFRVGTSNPAGDAIVMATSTALIGAGGGTTITLASSTPGNANVIALNSLTDTTVANLVIDGNRANQSSGTQNGIVLSYTGTSTVQNLIVKNMRGDGMYLFIATNNNITASTFTGNLSYGIDSYISFSNAFTGNNSLSNTLGLRLNSSAYSTFSSNIFSGNSSSGIYMSASVENMLSGNTISMNGSHGVEMQNSNRNIVTGNTISSNTANGVYVFGQNNTITGNSINSNTGSGVNLTSAINNTVASNSFYDNTGATGASTISLFSSSVGNTISGNTISDTAGTGYAIYLGATASADNVISGNYYSGVGASTISDIGVNTKYTQWDRLKLDTLQLGQVAYSPLSILASSSVALASTTQLGTGKILSLSNGFGEMFTVANSGNVGIGTTSPYAKLSVVGDVVADSFNATSSVGYKLGSTTLLTASSTLGNTFVGFGVGTSTTGGGSQQNTFVGYQVGQANTTGFANTANGFQSLFLNNTGGWNTTNGYQSLFLNTSGGANTANGAFSLYSNTTGSGNTSSGNQSLYANTTGSYNTASGYASLISNTTGGWNTANGFNSLNTNTTGSHNTAIGDSSLYFNTTGASSTAVGYRAGYNNTTGNFNTFLGFNSGYTDGTTATIGTLTNATAIGYNAQVRQSNSLILGGTGAYGVNVGIGTTSPYAKLSVVGETLSDSFNATSSVGYKLGGTTLLTASSTRFNTFVGLGVGTSTTIGGNNTFVGYQSGQANTSGARNVGTGFNALYANTTGTQNTAYGSEALVSNTTGNSNTASGYQALFTNTTGALNVANGYQSMGSNTTGIANTTNGYQSLYSNTTGSSNAAYGGLSLFFNTGSYNTANGNYSLFNNTTGASSTAMGYAAGYSNTTGSFNTFLGFAAGYGDGLSTTTATLTNATAIGYNAQVQQSNSLILGGTGAYGVNVGIGTTSPFAKLSVVGTTELDGVTTILTSGTGSGGLVLNANTSGAALPTVPHTGAIHIVGKDNDFAALYIDTFGSFGGVGGDSYRSIINLRSARGTLAAPLPGLTGDEVGRLAGRGYNGTNFTGSLSALSFMLAEPTTATAQGSYAIMRTTAIGTTGGGSLAVPPETVRFQPSGGLSVGDEIFNATDPGHGSLSIENNLGIGTSSPYAKLSVVGNVVADSFNATSSVGYQQWGTILLTASSTRFNTFVGLGAGTSTTIGSSNTFVGYQVGQANTSALNNTGVGYQSLFSNTTGNANTAYGVVSLTSNISGFQNTAMGISSLRSNTSGSYNTANGALSLYNTVIGNYNTAFGYYAGEYNTGSNNTFFGANAGYNDGTISTPAALTNAAAIGYNAQVTASSSFILGGTGAYSVNVGIGTTSPMSLLSIASTTGASVFTVSNGTVIGHFGEHVTGATTLDIGTQSAHDVSFETSDLTRMTIGGTTGNIGIGTTSPYAKLSVVGEIVGAYFTATSTTATSSFTAGVNVGNGNGYFINGALAVSGANNNPTSFGFSNTVSSSGIAFGNANTASNVLSQAFGSANIASGILSFATGYSNQATSSNDFAIGLNNKAGGSSSIAFGLSNNTWAAGAIAIGSGITNITANSLQIGPSDAAKLTILSSGNVGIGTTSPYAKLSVVGEIVGQMFTATSTTATSTIAGGLNIGSGGFVYDYSSGVTSITSLNLGSANFDTDAGILSWVDMPVTSSATIGTVESYSAQIDGNALLTVYSQSNGAGGIQNYGIGIGTTTPTSLLSVVGTTTIGSLSTGTQAGLQIGYGGLCVDNDGTCVASTTGRISAVSYTTGSTDLAENYFSTTKLTPGDIVMMDATSTSAYITLGDKQNTNRILGIVSTKPAIILGLENDMPLPNQYPIALAGRVPVSVNLEHGPIKQGDRITISSTPGVGTKATATSSLTVGIALQDWNGVPDIMDTMATGTVLTFVNLQHANLSSQISGSQFNLTSTSSELIPLFGLDAETNDVRYLASRPFNFAGQSLLNVKSIVSSSGKWSLSEEGRLVVEDLEVKGNVKVGSPENRTGVTLFDQETGAPYCIKMVAGVLGSAQGQCGSEGGFNGANNSAPSSTGTQSVPVEAAAPVNPAPSPSTDTSTTTNSVLSVVDTPAPSVVPDILPTTDVTSSTTTSL